MTSHKELLGQILKIVETDFVEDMVVKNSVAHYDADDGKFTQKESESMAKILGEIYSIAHKVSGCCNSD